MEGSKAGNKGGNEAEGRVDALGRKVWDRNYFTGKALTRSSGGDVVEDTISSLYQGTFKKPVIAVPEVKEDLKPRTETLDFTKFVGKSELLDADGPKSKQGGFFCKTCNCLLKDSQSYLDHLNGRKHNRLLGMTMRVQKVDAKTVAQKLKTLAASQTSAKTKKELENDARERIQELEMYQREMKERKKMMKKVKKQQLHNSTKSEPVKLEPSVKSEPGVKLEYDNEMGDANGVADDELELMKASGFPISFT